MIVVEMEEDVFMGTIRKNNEYKIWQIKDIGNCDYAFRGYPKNGIDKSDYECVWESVYEREYEDDMWILEDLFTVFNVRHPAGYKGKSLSVSDVVELGNGNVYYCDRWGWTKVEQW